MAFFLPASLRGAFLQDSRLATTPRSGFEAPGPAATREAAQPEARKRALADPRRGPLDFVFVPDKHRLMALIELPPCPPAVIGFAASPC